MIQASDPVRLENVVNMTLGQVLNTLAVSGMRIDAVHNRVYLFGEDREITLILYHQPGTAMEVVVEGWVKMLRG